MRRGPTIAIASALGAAGCPSPPPPFPRLDETGSSTTPASADVDDATTAIDDGATSTGRDPSTGTTDGSSSGASLAETLLAFDERGPIDLGMVTIATPVSANLTVRNVGNAPAMDLLGDLLPPLAWVGGAFPGIGGTCGAELGQGDACSVTVEFSPTRLGPRTVQLSVAASNAPATSIMLQGFAIGTTPNLILNGDAEQGGAPPVEWSSSWAVAWATVDGQMFAPHGGQLSIYGGADTMSPQSLVVLTQTIDVASMAQVIDGGLVVLEMTGWIAGPSSSRGLFRVRSYDGGGTPLTSFTAPPGGSSVSPANWQQYFYSQLASIGTRTIDVDIECTNGFGDPSCITFFDDLRLTATYPPD